MSTCVHILMNFVWSRCAFGPPSVIDSGRRGWTCGDLSTSKPRPFIRPAPLHKLVCDLFRPLVRFVAVISLLSFRFSFCLFLLFDCLSRVGFLFLTHFPRLRFKTRKRKTFVTAVPESFKLLFFFLSFAFASSSSSCSQLFSLFFFFMYSASSMGALACQPTHGGTRRPHLSASTV